MYRHFSDYHTVYIPCRVKRVNYKVVLSKCNKYGWVYKCINMLLIVCLLWCL